MRTKAALFVPLVLAAGVVACNSDTALTSTCILQPTVTTTAVAGAITAQDCALEKSFDKFPLHLNANQPVLFTVTHPGSWQPVLEVSGLSDTTLRTYSSLNVFTSNSVQLGIVSATAVDEVLDVVADSGMGAYTLRQEDCAFDATPVDAFANDSVASAISAADCVLRDSLFPDDSMHVHLYSFDYPDTATKRWRIVVRGLSGTSLGAPLNSSSVFFWGPMGAVPGTAGTLGRSYTLAGDSTVIIGPQQGLGKGKYFMAVGGKSFTDVGAYSLLLSPAPF